MASTTLYPPIVDSYIPAFIASGDSAYCRVYYSLSKFSSSIDSIKSIHFSVVKQSSGQSVVNRAESGNSRFRSTGILVLNTKPNAVEGQENWYYTDILNEDIKDGWTAGWMYKIQVRFGTVAYSDASIGLASWLNLNANNFSEWSTYTITKATGQPEITIPIFNYRGSAVGAPNSRQTYTIAGSELELTGSYSNADASELLYSYEFNLYQQGVLLENSDVQYANLYAPNQIYYLFDTKLVDGAEYVLTLKYETINHYTDTKTFNLSALISYSDIADIQIITAEDLGKVGQLTSIEEDQTAGRVSLKLSSSSDKRYFGNICIRRSDSRTNFTLWEDIKILPIVNQNINDIEVFYDYTIESGVWYKYGVQEIDASGFRSTLVEHDLIKREFDYAFLLGENNKQLRLIFDNTMNSFRHVVSDSKIDTIGAQHPYVVRNGNMNYRTFPVNGLISFAMDLDNLFISQEEIYKYKEVVDLYNAGKEIKEYEYTYERDFRNEVLAFLQDGKPKLFKSPTEGNIIIRLVEVSTSPNTTLGRLVSSFTSTAYEIDSPTMDNYLKYNFYKVGDAEAQLVTTESKLGQFIGTVPVGSNLFTLIAEKYSNPDYLGQMQAVVKISNLSLTFPGPALAVVNNAGVLTAGHNIELNNNLITVSGKDYVFDSLASFTPSENLIVKGDAAGQVSLIDIEANFTIEITTKPIAEKIVAQRSASKNIGQVALILNPGESIYDIIYYKYLYEWDDSFRQLYDLKCLCLEAEPGTEFSLRESIGSEGTTFIMNLTGVFDLTDLGSVIDVTYEGEDAAEVIVDYVYYILEGTYA